MKTDTKKAGHTTILTCIDTETLKVLSCPGQREGVLCALHAAAPDLLRAVKSGQKAIKALVAAIEAGNDVGLNGSEWLEFQRLALNVIAKAEGRA